MCEPCEFAKALKHGTVVDEDIATGSFIVMSSGCMEPSRCTCKINKWEERVFHHKAMRRLRERANV